MYNGRWAMSTDDSAELELRAATRPIMNAMTLCVDDVRLDFLLYGVSMFKILLYFPISA